MKKHIKNNVSWVGKIDWELREFHGSDYSVHRGSSQNSYLIEEEKVVLIDTVWEPHSNEFVENLKSEIDLNKIDYIITNHGEVDHAGSLVELLKEIPDVPIYCTENGKKSIIGQFHHPEWNFVTVKTGDFIDIGNGKSLIFVEMPMLHWPDSMAVYLTQDNILFSNDAFGQHYAVEELFNDKADQCALWEESMKYFANILNPFAPLVTRKIKEVVGLELPIDIIAPSHGVVWRENPLKIIEKYTEWADAYQEDQITIVYDTMWNGTKTIAHEIAGEISKQAPETKVKVLSISHNDKNDIMTEVFKSKAIVVGSPTYLNDVLGSVAGWLHFLKSLKFKNKKAAVFGTYGWSGEGNKVLKERLAEGGFDVIDKDIKVNWNPKEENLLEAKELVTELLK